MRHHQFRRFTTAGGKFEYLRVYDFDGNRLEKFQRKVDSNEPIWKMLEVFDSLIEQIDVTDPDSETADKILGIYDFLEEYYIKMPAESDNFQHGRWEREEDETCNPKLVEEGDA